MTVEKLAQDAAMRLRDDGENFAGDIGECWQVYVDEYRQVATDYNLSPIQKLQFLHNLLSGNSKQYYLDIDDGYAIYFQQAVDMV